MSNAAARKAAEKKGTQQMIGVYMPRAMMVAIDEAKAERQAEDPSKVVSRGDIVREAIAKHLGLKGGAR
jgi:hypothetical protein